MHTLIETASLFFAALATGGLMVNWIGLARAMRRVRSASAYVEFHQATNGTFDPYMPITVVGALVGSLLIAAVQPSLLSLASLVALLGAGCYAAVLVFSIVTNLPLNRQVATWSVANPPSDWACLRQRWIRFHVVRTVVSVPALVCCIVAALSPP